MGLAAYLNFKIWLICYYISEISLLLAFCRRTRTRVIEATELVLGAVNLASCGVVVNVSTQPSFLHRQLSVF